MAIAWSKVKDETILKCFKKAGVLDNSLDVVARPAEDADPFIEADAQVELEGLIARALPPSKSCSMEEYVEGDNDLPVCPD